MATDYLGAAFTAVGGVGRTVTKKPEESQGLSSEAFSLAALTCGQRKSLATTYSPTAIRRSTIGAGGLNFRVRNGNGWVPSAMVTRQLKTTSIVAAAAHGYPRCDRHRGKERVSCTKPLQWQFVVQKRPALLPYEATQWLRGGIVREYGQASRKISTGRLNTLPHLDRQPIDQIISLVPSVRLKRKGCLILRGASHLDAFSGYPVHTWLPSTCRWHDNWYTRGTSTPVLSY